MLEIDQEQSTQLTKLLEQGQLLRQQDRATAIAVLEQCIQAAEAVGTPRLLANVLIELALALIETCQLSALQRAKSLLLRAEILLVERQDYDSILAYLLYCRGVLYLQQRNFVDSLVHLRSAYRAYENNLEGRSRTDDALGGYYAALGDFQAALFHLERSLQCRQSQNSGSQSRETGLSYAHLGKLYLQMSQYDRAESYFQQGLEIAMQWEDRYLQIWLFIGLGQIALGCEQWQEAKNLLYRALQLSHPSTDLVNIAYLHLYLAESLLGEKRYTEAEEHIEAYAIPHFQALDDSLGVAAATRTWGKILTFRLKDGIDRMEPEVIETIEDLFMEASLLFEHGMPQEYARTLYDMAYLYRVCLDSNHRYQYQGKAVRALELALSILEKVNYGAASLIFQIEVLLNQVDQTVWLDRAVNRLRGKKRLEAVGVITSKKEEVTLLFADLCEPGLFVELEPDTAMHLLNLYLRYMSDAVQKYRGIISHFNGDGLMAIFRTSPEELRSVTENSQAISSPTTEQNHLPHALKAALAAQEMQFALEVFNQELGQRLIPPQQIRIGIDTGEAVIGNVGIPPSTEFVAIGDVVNLAARFCNVAEPNEIRLGTQTYAVLSKILYYRAIATTEISEHFKGIGNVITHRLDELSYYSEPTNKSIWLLNAKFPALIRSKLPLHPYMSEVVSVSITAVVNKLNFTPAQRQSLVHASAEIYASLLKYASTQEELSLLIVPEENSLEVSFNLEAKLEEANKEIQNVKNDLEQLSHTRTSSLAQVSQYHVETTPSSFTIRVVQSY
jgi:class 3 adenylate cyclase